jgi:hypothetical protein
MRLVLLGEVGAGVLRGGILLGVLFVRHVGLLFLE